MLLVMWTTDKLLAISEDYRSTVADNALWTIVNISLLGGQRTFSVAGSSLWTLATSPSNKDSTVAESGPWTTLTTPTNQWTFTVPCNANLIVAN